MEELARRNLIRPVTTQGHIGDVLPDKIVYDAQTTSGGSGGPLFNNEGKVKELTLRWCVSSEDRISPFLSAMGCHF
jgi:S1-C subfamily serine protease